MWVVSGVELDIGLREIKSLPFMMLRESIIRSSPAVHLCNYKTKKQVVLRDLTLEGFLRELQKYKPYGFVNERHFSEAVYGYPVVVIDKFSWKFLDYVDDVVVRIRNTAEASLPVVMSDYFEAVDSDYTLFRNLDFDRYCTLFSAVYSDLGVYSGGTSLLSSTDSTGTYLLHGHLESGDSDYPFPVVYSIHINDLRSVRILLSKASLAGVQPIQAYENYC